MSWIDVTYHLRGKAADAETRARAIAVEQSIEMPPEAVGNSEIVSNILGRVTAVEALGADLHAVRIQLAAATVGADAGQLLNMLFGNSSLHDDLTLVDAELPASLQRELGSGPRAGLRGLRARMNAGHAP